MGIGIAFNSSSFRQIDALAKTPTIPGLNAYLDSTFGYYTLDNVHKFILAHYNWHSFASRLDASRHDSRRANLENIRNTLNRRIDRLFRLCEDSKHILFVFDNHDQYSFMSVDEVVFSLSCLDGVKRQAAINFGNKVSVCRSPDLWRSDFLDMLCEQIPC